jgi:DNA polymerase
LSVIGDLVRSMVCAAPGHTLIGGDFSGIEARITAYLAGQENKLAMFRAYDAGTGPDPYIVAAARIKNLDPVALAAAYQDGDPVARELRQIGKAAELAFGFAGAIGAYRKFASDTTLSDDEIQKINDTWRKAHPFIVNFWGALHNSAWIAVKKETRYTVNELIYFEFDGSTLWMTLPSGRRLAYPDARIANVWSPEGSKVIVELEAGDKRGRDTLLFKDNSQGQWRDVRAWRGTWCENVVSATARDLLAAAIVRLDAAGFKLVAHVHDEVVAEVPTASLPAMQIQFAQLMSEVPAYVEGLPIAVQTWTSDRFQ